jgi:glycosyltransferase involved in cell wall biosynthesis
MKTIRTVVYVERNVDGTIGGSYRSLLYLVQLLPKDRWRPIVVFYRDHHLVEAYRKAGCEVLLFDYPQATNLVAKAGALGRFGPTRAAILVAQKGINFARGSLALIARYVSLFRRERAAVLHLNNGVMSGTELLVAARMLGVRTIVHQRGIQPLPSSFKSIRRLIDHVISVSDAARDHLVQHGLDPAACTTVHNGIDPEGFRGTVTRDAAEVRASLGIPADALIVGNAGMVKAWKGQHVLVEAMGQLRESHPNAYCVIVGGTSDNYQGDTVYLKRITDTIEQYRLHDRVQILGYQAVVADYLQIFDVMVHTSIEPEPFSRSVLEGMTMGRAMVASRTGGTPEAIEHGVTGILVEPNAPGELATQLAALLGDPQRRAALGDRARQRIDERFSIRTNVEATQRIYARVLDGADPAVRTQTA